MQKSRSTAPSHASLAGARSTTTLSSPRKSSRPQSAAPLRSSRASLGSTSLLSGKRPASARPDLGVEKELGEKERGLLQAVEEGRLDRVYEALWENPGRSNCRNPVLGLTPLSVACRNGNRRIAHILLSFGADVTATDGYGVTPLHWAANSGNIPLVALLLRQALRKGNAKPVLASLTSLLASLPTTDKSKAAPPPPPVKKGDREPPNLLTSRDGFGSTALHFASVNNLKDVANVLLTAGSDPTVKNNDGRMAHELTTDETLRTLLTNSETHLRSHLVALRKLQRKIAKRAAKAAAEEAEAKKNRGSSRPTSAVAVKKGGKTAAAAGDAKTGGGKTGGAGKKKPKGRKAGARPASAPPIRGEEPASSLPPTSTARPQTAAPGRRGDVVGGSPSAAVSGTEISASRDVDMQSHIPRPTPAAAGRNRPDPPLSTSITSLSRPKSAVNSTSSLTSSGSASKLSKKKLKSSSASAAGLKHRSAAGSRESVTGRSSTTMVFKEGGPGSGSVMTHTAGMPADGGGPKPPARGFVPSSATVASLGGAGWGR